MIPTHFKIALDEIGVKEVAGPASNSRIDEYLATVGLSGDETPWCAAFVEWVLQQSGSKGTGAANARSYLKWGIAVPKNQVQRGDICIIERGNSSWQGHVFIVDAVTDTGRGVYVYGVGGNQGNTVSMARFPIEKVLGFRRSKSLKDSKTIASAAGAVVTYAADKAVEKTIENTSLIPDFVTTIEKAKSVSEAADVAKELVAKHAPDVLPAVSNGTLRLVLMSLFFAFIGVIVYERLKRWWETRT